MAVLLYGTLRKRLLVAVLLVVVLAVIQRGPGWVGSDAVVITSDPPLELAPAAQGSASALLPKAPEGNVVEVSPSPAPGEPATASDMPDSELPVPFFRPGSVLPSPIVYTELEKSREFCRVLPHQIYPQGPRSQFHESTSSRLRTAAITAMIVGTPGSKTALEAALTPFAKSAPCYWAMYVIPNRNLQEIPLCTHDPAEDLISNYIHRWGHWFGASTYTELMRVLAGVDNECPPDRPVVLDLGVNIGTFALYALERGCHVIGFDVLEDNMKHVIQTVAKGKGNDGRPLLERFHGYTNAVDSVVGRVSVVPNKHNMGASRVVGADADQMAQAGDQQLSSVDAVVLEDLLFHMEESARPQVRVGTRDNATGEWVYAMTPLRPEHIVVVKVDVEGWELPAMYGLRRLLESGIKPAGIAMELAIGQRVKHNHCIINNFVSYMYMMSYRFTEDGDIHYTSKEELLKEIAFREACDDALPDCHHVLEGWWKLARQAS